MRWAPTCALLTIFATTAGVAQTASPLSSSYEADKVIAIQPTAAACSFHEHANAHNLLRYVLRCYGVDAAIDASVPDRPVSFDLDQASFDTALEAVELVTASFGVALGSTRAIFFADNDDNRRKHEHIALGTLHLLGMSQAEINEIAGLLRSMLEPNQYSYQASLGSITVRAPERELVPLEAVLQELLNGRSEVLLEVEVYEIDMSSTRAAGVVLPGSTKLFNVASEVSRILAANADAVQQIIAKGLADAGDYQKIVAILIAAGLVKDSSFSSPFVVFGGGLTEMGLNIGDVAATLVLNSADARSLRQAQLRLLDQEEGVMRIGSRYPLLTSSTSNVGSASKVPAIPQFQYTDLGVTFKATPRINQSGEVALGLDLSVSSLTGAKIGDLPVMANRQYGGTVVLHSGQTALVVGVLEKQTESDKTGLPGPVSDTHRSGAMNSTEIVVMVTPHVVRLAHNREAGPVFVISRH